MKYKNKYTGVIAEPSCDVAAQTFVNSADWVEFAGETTEDHKDKPLSKMTTAELTEKAAELGVDISECKNNAERAAKITEALEGGEE